MNKIEIEAVIYWNNIVKKLREKKKEKEPKQSTETTLQKKNDVILWSDKESSEEWNKRINIEIEDLKKANRFDWDIISYLYFIQHANRKTKDTD